MVRRSRLAFSVLSLAAIWLLILEMSAAQARHADTSHALGRYPNTGFAWIDQYKTTGAWIYVSSDLCKAEENTMLSRVNQTLPGGSLEFSGWWPSGIEFIRYTNEADCTTTTTDDLTDIHFDYLSPSAWDAAHPCPQFCSTGDNEFGGHTHQSLAPQSWCDLFGFPKEGTYHRCGYNPVRIEVNNDRYNNVYGTLGTNYRRDFLLHETGHAMGFRDYCGHTSVSRQHPTCSWSGGYMALDREMFRQYIYI